MASEQSHAGEWVNIDLRPDVVFEALATVEKDERGKPFLRPSEPSRWNAALGRLAGKGKVRVSIVREKGPRSNQQNKYLWAIVYEDYLSGLRARAADVAMECPFRDKDDLHYHLKHKYVGQTVQRFMDEEIVIAPSTTRLSIEQFSTYVSLIMAEAAQREIYIRAAGEE